MVVTCRALIVSKSAQLNPKPQFFLQCWSMYFCHRQQKSWKNWNVAMLKEPQAAASVCAAVAVDSLEFELTRSELSKTFHRFILYRQNESSSFVSNPHFWRHEPLNLPMSLILFCIYLQALLHRTAFQHTLTLTCNALVRRGWIIHKPVFNLVKK